MKSLLLSTSTAISALKCVSRWITKTITTSLQLTHAVLKCWNLGQFFLETTDIKLLLHMAYILSVYLCL